MERVMSLAGPTHELPPQDTAEKKFCGRNRLYVGNLTNDITEEEIQSLFSPFGQVSELFVNKEKNFAFLRMVRFNYFYIYIFILLLILDIYMLINMIIKITV